jgi:hypothetical protein
MKQWVWLALAVLATLWLVTAIVIDTAANVVAEIAVQGGWTPVGKSRSMNEPADTPSVPSGTSVEDTKSTLPISRDPMERAETQSSITKPAAPQPPETDQR